MKKSFILIGLAFLTFGTTLKAQSDDSREVFAFGIKAGINYSNVWDAQGQDFRADPKVGFVGGVFAGIPIGKTFGIQPELLVSQKGFKGSGTLLFTPYSFSRTTTFIDVPLLLQIKPAQYITLLAGPHFSYLLHQKDEYTFGSNSTEQEKEFSNDNIRKNILGFTFGADINISNIVISGRVAYDFQANNGDGTSQTPRYKNQWLQLAVGFKI